MSGSDDLDALLGAGFVDEIIGEVQEEERSAPPTAIAPRPKEEDNLETMPVTIITDTADVVRKSNEAITAVLMDLQAAPADPAVMAGAAQLMNAHAQLLAQFNKTNTLYAKMQHEKEMLMMKLATDKQMNDDNNQTKVMLTREEMFRDLKAEMEKGN